MGMSEYVFVGLSLSVIVCVCISIIVCTYHLCARLCVVPLQSGPDIYVHTIFVHVCT